MYEDDRSGNSNIYLYDSAIGQERAMTSGGSRHYRPVISSAGVSWQDDRNATWDVYLDEWTEFPEAPANLSSMGLGGSIFLDWDDEAAPDLSGYAVYRNTAPGGGWEPIALTTLSTYVDGSVQAGVQYSYRIAAVNKKGAQGGFSNESLATP